MMQGMVSAGRRTGPLWDVVIVGGGPAGLCAALVLGRCNRSVLICDAGKPRNRFTRQLHAFPTRDGIRPEDFLKIARQNLSSYPHVLYRRGEVFDAGKDATGCFTVRLDHAAKARGRKLLLATGIADDLPTVQGIEALYGRSVFHCPYCDGWEWRHQPLAVYARGRRAYEMCVALSAWSEDIVLCSDGPSELSSGQKTALLRNRIRISEEPISRLSGRRGRLEAVVFESGDVLRRSALFFNTPTRQQSQLAKRLGCAFRPDGGIRCTRHEATSVAGVFVAGNAIKDVQLVVVAAAEGAKAAFGINRALTRERFMHQATGVRRCLSSPPGRGEQPAGGVNGASIPDRDAVMA